MVSFYADVAINGSLQAYNNQYCRLLGYLGRKEEPVPSHVVRIRRKIQWR